MKNIINTLKSNNIKEKKHIINTFLVILATILIIVGIFFIVKDYIDENNAIKIEATIKEHPIDTTTYTVTYIIESKEYEKIIKLNHKDLTVNDKVEIKYHKNNPNIIIHNEHLVLSIILILVSIILYIYSLKPLIKYNNEKKRIKLIKQSGFLINAPITEVITNGLAPKYKGKYPYRLRIRYINPQDNLTYTFDSEDLYFNVHEILRVNNIRTVVIYIDRANTLNYYVDITNLEKLAK